MSLLELQSACDFFDSSSRVRGLLATLCAEFQVLQQRGEHIVQDNRELREQVSYLRNQDKERVIAPGSIPRVPLSVLSQQKELPVLPLSKESTSASSNTQASTAYSSSLLQMAQELNAHSPGAADALHRTWQGLLTTPRCATPGCGPLASNISSPVTPKEVPCLDDDAGFDERGTAEFSDEKGVSANLSCGKESRELTFLQDLGTRDLQELDNEYQTEKDVGRSSRFLKQSLKILYKEEIREKHTDYRRVIVFDTIPAIVILANACTIGMSADIEPQSGIWDVLEGCWIFFYSLEFIVKVWFFSCKEYFTGPDRKWNWFDFGCLVLSLSEQAIRLGFTFIKTPEGATGLMKMLRLARLARIVRALHYSIFDELKQMLLGVVSGVRVLFWAIVLLLVCIFFVGVGMNSLIGDKEEELSTVPIAMITTFRCFTDGCTAFDGTPLQRRLLDRYGALFFFGYILAFMFVSVGIFNLIMAIFIDNVFVRSLKRRLIEIGSNTDRIEGRVKQTVTALITDYAVQHPNWDQIKNFPPPQEFTISKVMASNVMVTRQVFCDWLEDPKMIDLLEDADIETAAKAELFDVMDVDMGGELGLDEVISGIMRLRGPMTKTDMVSVVLKVRYVTSMIEDVWRRTCDMEKDEEMNADAQIQEMKLMEKKRMTVKKAGTRSSATLNGAESNNSQIFHTGSRRTMGTQLSTTT